MQKILKRLPRMTGRSLFLIMLLALTFCYDFDAPSTRVLTIILLFPWGCCVAYGAIRSYKGELGWKNGLLIGASAFLIIAAVRSRELDEITLYALGGELLCMLGVGIVPKDTEPETLRRELLSLAWAMMIIMLPMMFLSVLSVFWGEMFTLGSGRMGLEYAGRVQSRIYIGHHPNIGGRRAEMCILFAIYALYYSKKHWQRVLLWFTIVLSVLAITHSQTRSCNLTLAVIFGALAFRWVYLRFQGKKWRLAAGLGSAAAAAVLTVVALNVIFWVDVNIAVRVMPAYASAEEFGASRVMTKGLFNIEGSGRTPIWNITIDFLKAHPTFLLVGTGAGDVTARMSAEFPRASYFAHLHNSFLEIMVRGGIPMLLCSVGLLALLVKPCWQMLVAPETDGDRGAYILPIIIGSMLLMTVTESMLFIRPTVINIIFFYAVSRVVYADRRKTIGKAV